MLLILFNNITRLFKIIFNYDDVVIKNQQMFRREISTEAGKCQKVMYLYP